MRYLAYDPAANAVASVQGVKPAPTHSSCLYVEKDNVYMPP